MHIGNIFVHADRNINKFQNKDISIFEMLSAAMKIKVKDSEKSSKLFLANAKENKMLAKEMRSLDISEKTVVNRISNNQKILYKTFQRKIQRSETGLARLKGDKESEQELRQRQTKFNTSLANDEEVNEVLKRIWRTGSAKVARRRMMERAHAGTRRVKSAVIIRTPEPRDESRGLSTKVTSAVSPSGVKIQVRRRPATASSLMKNKSVTLPPEDAKPPRPPGRPTSAWEMTPGRSSSKGQYIVTRGLGNVEESDGEDAGRLQRPKTAPHMLGHTRPGTTDSSRPRTTPMSSAAQFITGNDPWEQARSELMEFHRARLQAAQFERRISVFCDSVKPFTQDKDRFIEDYYYSRLTREDKGDSSESDEQDEERPRSVRFRRHSSTTASEIRRATGNPSVRSLTLKTLNWNFTPMFINNDSMSTNSEGNSSDTSELDSIE